MRTKEQPEIRNPKSGVNGVECRMRVLGPRTSNLRVRIVLLAAFLLVVPAARADDARRPTVETIGSEVQCPCGCVAPLNQCPMLNCAEKAEMRAFITKEIADGKAETTILQDLSLRYGLQVLSAPPAHGFNLAVWVLPGIGLLMGLGMVVVIVRRWNRKPSVAAAPSSASADPKVLTAVEEEMKSAGMGRI